MKKNILFGILLTTVAVGCTEHDAAQEGSADKQITFAPTVKASDWNDTRSAVQAFDGAQKLFLHTTVTPTEAVQPTTRGAKYTGTTFANNETFYVSGYRYGSGETVNNVAEANFMWNTAVTKIQGVWTAPQEYIWPYDGDKIDFFAYFIPAGGAGVTPINAAGGLKLTYALPTNIAAQPDLLTAVCAGETHNTAPNYMVPLTFQHALTSVSVEIDENVAPGTITEVAFMNIYTSGTLSVGSGLWDFTNGMKPEATVYETDFSTTSNTGAIADADHRTVLSGLMMIPQSFTTIDQQIRVKMTIGDEQKTLFANLSPDLDHPTSWETGATVTYKITTSDVNVLRLNTVTYPNSWSTTSLKNAYAEGDALGLFSVDADGKVVYANKKVSLNNAGQWVCDDAATTLFAPGYTYYAYYPWQSALTDAPAVDDNVLVASELPTAAQFFADAVTAWTPSFDQSTEQKLYNADLHIGRCTSAVNASTVNVTMAHTMGLASVTMGSMEVANVIYYNSNETVNGRTAATTAVITSNNFTGNLPCELNGKHYFIVKPEQDYTFAATPQGDLDAWSSNITANVAAGGYTNYTAPSKFITRNYIYRGWVYSYTGGVQTFTVPTTGNYTLEVWGAAGGDVLPNVSGVTSYPHRYEAVGGKGGYSSGTKSLSKNETLYLCVGGKGGNGTTYNEGWRAAGYNGGGRAYNFETAHRFIASSGGGATHIATESVGNGLLMNYSSEANRQKILIVAGGGGGASWNYLVNGANPQDGWYSHAIGGDGGGLVGTTSTIYRTNSTDTFDDCWGTQTEGGTASNYGNNGSFGQGAESIDTSRFGTQYVENSQLPGGGGGWYGGGSGWGNGGGGGSGYIGGVTDGTSTAGQRTGNGYCRITSKVIE